MSDSGDGVVGDEREMFASDTLKLRAMCAVLAAFLAGGILSESAIWATADTGRRSSHRLRKEASRGETDHEELSGPALEVVKQLKQLLLLSQKEHSQAVSMAFSAQLPQWSPLSQTSSSPSSPLSLSALTSPSLTNSIPSSSAESMNGVNLSRPSIAPASLENRSARYHTRSATGAKPRDAKKRSAKLENGCGSSGSTYMDVDKFLDYFRKSHSLSEAVKRVVADFPTYREVSIYARARRLKCKFDPRGGFYQSHKQTMDNENNRESRASNNTDDDSGCDSSSDSQNDNAQTNDIDSDSGTGSDDDDVSHTESSSDGTDDESSPPSALGEILQPRAVKCEAPVSPVMMSSSFDSRLPTPLVIGSEGATTFSKVHSPHLLSSFKVPSLPPSSANATVDFLAMLAKTAKELQPSSISITLPNAATAVSHAFNTTKEVLQADSCPTRVTPVDSDSRNGTAVSVSSRAAVQVAGTLDSKPSHVTSPFSLSDPRMKHEAIAALRCAMSNGAATVTSHSPAVAPVNAAHRAALACSQMVPFALPPHPYMPAQSLNGSLLPAFASGLSLPFPAPSSDDEPPATKKRKL